MGKGELESNKDVEDLIQKLEKANYHWCTDVVIKLGEIGNEKVVAPLIKALENGGKTERIAAAEALGKIGSKRAVDPLIKAIEKGGMEERSIVAGALGKIGDQRAVDHIIKLFELQRSEGKIYYDVTNALASLSGEKAIEPLSEILENVASDAKLCGYVISALAKIASERAIYAIIRVLSDYRAPFSISPIALPSVGDYAIKTLEDIGKPAVVPLINSIASDDNFIRVDHVIEILGKIGDKRAVEPLVELLRSKHDKAASFALESIGQPAVAVLTKALNDEDESVRNRAEKVLKKIEGR